jgi:hypothetical protein
MNQAFDDPLFFDALTYVLDEMSPSDRDAFEKRLGDEQDAREAVTQAVWFCQRVVSSQAESSWVTEILPAAPLEKTWRRPAIWGAAAVAIAASVMALAVIENRKGAAPGVASAAKESGKQLAVAWARVSSPAEALGEGNPGEGDTGEGETDGERQLEGANNENEVPGSTEPSPAVDWVLEALTASLSRGPVTNSLHETGLVA